MDENNIGRHNECLFIWWLDWGITNAEVPKLILIGDSIVFSVSRLGSGSDFIVFF